MLNVYILLDRSGSMETKDLYKEAVGSINGYVEALKGNSQLVVATFDDVSYDIIRNTNIEGWKKLTPEDAYPRGSTPLYDASVRLMNRALEDNAEKTVLVIMTDGFENTSKNNTLHDVKEKVKLFQNKGWEVVFLGANFDRVSEVSASYGLAKSKSINSSKENLNWTMRGLAGQTVAYAEGAATMDWNEDEQAIAASTVKASNAAPAKVGETV